MELQQAKELLDNLKAFNLPEEFERFNATRTFQLMEGVSLTFRIPNAIDLEWASAEANRVAVVKAGLAYSYIPRIMATTLVAIKGTPLHKWVKPAHEEMRIGLNEKMRRTLSYAAYVDTHDWVFDNIVGHIPFDLLRAIYDNGLSDWMDSAGGLLVIPSDDELADQAIADLSNLTAAVNTESQKE